MRSSPPLLLLVVLAVGCGGTSFAGLGDGDEIDAGESDTSGGGDSLVPGGDTLFPLDDSGEDTTPPDDAATDVVTSDGDATTDPDAVVADALDGAIDGAIDATDGSVDVTLVDGDALALDGADSTLLDTGVTDGIPTDTAVTPDSAVAETTPDTSVTDTGVIDTSVTDTGVIDTSATDTGTPDTGTPEIGPIDTGTPDLGTPDTGAGPLGATPLKVACYDSEHSTSSSCDLPGSVCCGFIPFGSFSYKWDCRSESGCGFTDRHYRCDDKTDCASGSICCASRTITGTINGGECRSSCGSDPQICRQTSECGGKTCVAQTAPDSPISIGICK